jgi:hypothetical protein
MDHASDSESRASPGSYVIVYDGRCRCRSPAAPILWACLFLGLSYLPWLPPLPRSRSLPRVLYTSLLCDRSTYCAPFISSSLLLHYPLLVTRRDKCVKSHPSFLPSSKLTLVLRSRQYLPRHLPRPVLQLKFVLVTGVLSQLESSFTVDTSSNCNSQMTTLSPARVYDPNQFGLEIRPTGPGSRYLISSGAVERSGKACNYPESCLNGSE